MVYHDTKAYIDTMLLNTTKDLDTLISSNHEGNFSWHQNEPQNRVVNYNEIKQHNEGVESTMHPPT